MKKYLLLISVTIFTSISCLSQLKKSALFIGNSYTAGNSLSLLVAQIATSAGDTLIHSAHTPGGAQLVQHASNSTVINLISGSQWDYVVLQEQSQKPSFSPASVAANVFPYAKSLCDTIRFFNSCTQPIFFMTWGRKFGDAGNCPSASWLCTYEGMDSALASSYNSMGIQNDAYVSPVGAVWNYIRSNHPALNLYAGDNSHPNIQGSYAAACTFYTIIFQKNPTAVTFNSSLSPSDAQTIRNAVKSVCYDSLSKWNVGKFDPTANFTHAIFGSSIQFTNSSTLATTYTWDFGDGNTSNQLNPTHTYASNGSYSVSLIAKKCGVSDTLTKTISLTTVGLSKNELDDILIFPNPSTSGIITISNGKQQNFSIYSVHNKLIRKFLVNNNQEIIDLTTLSPGIYFLISDSGKVYKLIVE